MEKLAPIYDISASRVVERRAEIMKICNKKKVLHIGCTDSPYTEKRKGNLLHKDVSHVATKLWGIDPSSKGCKILKEMGFNNIIEGYVGEYIDKLREEEFEVILAGEVIEHVYNVGAFLDNMAKIAHPSSTLVITTINALSLRSFLFALLRKEKVHPNHNYYFSCKTIETLLVKAGFGDISVYYYNSKNNKIDKLLSTSRYISRALSDGLFVRAKIKSRS